MGSASPLTIEPGAALYDRHRSRAVRVAAVERIGHLVRLEFDDGEPIILDGGRLAERFEVRGGGASTPAAYSADPELVRQVAEGHRLAHAYLFDPFFAGETALIDPLPHQFTAVYDQLIPQPRLRFLLADDAGAGKTVMAGLYIRHQLARGAVRRVLVLAPAGLVGNWRRELWRFFHLRFEIVGRAETLRDNPFADPAFDLAVVSVDTAARERVRRLLDDPAVPPYDLALFDEAHKLSAYRDGKLVFQRSDRYALAEDLARRTRHLLLLTATPHMGKDEPYAALWRLLDPDLFASPDAVWALDPAERPRYLLRRLKEHMTDLEGGPLFRPRASRTVLYPLAEGPESEQALYEAVTAYCERFYASAASRNQQAAALALTILQRRLASSTWAILCSLRTRRAKLAEQLARLQQGLVGAADLAAQQAALPQADVRDQKTGDEEDLVDGEEESERADRDVQGATAADTVAERLDEFGEVERLCALAERVHDLKQESKFRKLQEALEAYPDAKVLLFTEYRDTADFLVRRLQGIGFGGRVARIDGGMPWEERERQVAHFAAEARFLVATDAAGEGINLQFCWLQVNYDVPWNPARLEQRLGRVHRYGQRHDVVALNMVAEGTREGRVLEVLFEKLERMRQRLRSDRVYDVLGELFAGRPLPEIIAEAVLRGRVDEARAEVAERVEGSAAVVAERTGGRVPTADEGGLLASLRARQEAAEQHRVMPAHVARFFAHAARYAGLVLEGDPAALGLFRISDPPPHVARALAHYPAALRDRLTFDRGVALPQGAAEALAVHLHPGEPVYEAVVGPFLGRHGEAARTGGVFRDPGADRPYLFALAGLPVLAPGEGAPEVAAEAFTGICWDPVRGYAARPAHWLATLQPAAGAPAEVRGFPSPPDDGIEGWMLREQGAPLLARAERERRERLAVAREQLQVAFNLREADLLTQRRKLEEARAKGDPLAEHQLRQCDAELDALDGRRQERADRLQAEVDGLRLGPVTVWARALALPGASDDPDAPFGESEQVAMAVARRAEELEHAYVEDVHEPTLAKGYDLESHRADGTVRWIEVKGRAGTGPVELSDHEWAQAAQHRDRYWLYVVWNCRGTPRLRRIPDPFGVLLAGARGGVRIEAGAIVRFPEEAMP